MMGISCPHSALHPITMQPFSFYPCAVKHIATIFHNPGPVPLYHENREGGILT